VATLTRTRLRKQRLPELHPQKYPVSGMTLAKKTKRASPEKFHLTHLGSSRSKNGLVAEGEKSTKELGERNEKNLAPKQKKRQSGDAPNKKKTPLKTKGNRNDRLI